MLILLEEGAVWQPSHLFEFEVQPNGSVEMYLPSCLLLVM